MATFIQGTDCGGCPGCSDDPCNPRPISTLPTLKCRTSSASKSKCGYAEYVGHESSPPKVYLVRTLSGSIGRKDFENPDCSDPCGAVNRFDYSGSNTYSRDTCEISYSAGANLYGSASDCTETFIQFDTRDDIQAYIGYLNPGYTEDFTATTRTITPSTECYAVLSTLNYGTFWKEELSSEYTTALLISDVMAALPAFGSFAACASGDEMAARDLSTDELTFSAKKGEYKFALPSGLVSGQCYKITWKEGGVSKSYTWDGSATETGVYTVDVPGSDGSVTITDIAAACTGC